MSVLESAAPLVLAGARGARAELSAYGAQVLGWRAAGDASDRLFLSATSTAADGAAIRGGIPVIFPQFATRGALPKHGFARTRDWRVALAEASRARFTLVDDAATRALWPHAFEAVIDVRLDADRLTVALEVENRDRAPLAFTAALHSYVRVGDVAATTIEGLAPAPLRLGAAVDHVFPEAGEPVRVVDRALSRATRLTMEGFRDVVLWNPGEAGGAALGDLEAGGWRRFVCVEAGAIERAVALEPGARWRGSQTLIAEPTDASA